MNNRQEVEGEDDELQEMVKEVFPSTGVYLCGPIRCVEDNGETWREKLVEDYPDFDYKNPLHSHHPDEVKVLSDPMDYEDESEYEQVLPSELTFTDKSLINQSEMVFVGLPDEIARGTCMEIMYAYERDIPVFVWKMDGHEESAWIYDHCEFMGDDRDEVMREMSSYV